MVDVMTISNPSKDGGALDTTNLNQLLLEVKNNFMSAERNLKLLNGHMELNNQKPTSHFHHNHFTNEKKKVSPVKPERQFKRLKSRKQRNEEVLGRLDSLMEDLEMSFTSLIKTNLIDDSRNNSSIDSNNNSFDDSMDDAFECLASSTPSSQRYTLDNYSTFLHRKFSLDHKPRRSSDSQLELKNQRRGMSESDMLHNISQHSTLCRRLKTLEASFGVTLKKQLHVVILNKMREMNVSGCVFCLYALYVSISQQKQQQTF